MGLARGPRVKSVSFTEAERFRPRAASSAVRRRRPRRAIREGLIAGAAPDIATIHPCTFSAAGDERFLFLSF